MTAATASHNGPAGHDVRTGDAAAIAGYLGSGDTCDRAMASFAESYADQNAADYGVLRHALDDGRIAAEAGL